MIKIKDCMTLNDNNNAGWYTKYCKYKIGISIIKFPHIFLQPFLHLLTRHPDLSAGSLDFIGFVFVIFFVDLGLFVGPVIEVVILIVDCLQFLHTQDILFMLNFTHYKYYIILLWFFSRSLSNSERLIGLVFFGIWQYIYTIIFILFEFYFIFFEKNGIWIFNKL